MERHPFTPINHLLPEGTVLRLAPNASAMAFVANGPHLQVGPEFSYQDLRADIEGLPVAVRKNKEGFYYQPHWVAYTALADANTDSQAFTAARRMASLPVNSSAPELGFPHSPALSILSRLVPRSRYTGPSADAKKKAPKQGESLVWNTDVPFLTFWSNLSADKREQALAQQGSELLENCLLTRRLLAAETLWEAGARLSAEALASGRAFLGLSGNAFDATPSLEMCIDMLRFKPFAQKMEAAAGSIPSTFSVWLEESKDRGLGSESYKACLWLVLMERWLERLVEAGLDPNASLAFNYRTPTGEEFQLKRRPFEHFLEEYNESLRRLQFLPFSPQAIDGERVLPVTAWVKRWAQAMRQASFEWGANVEARAEQSQIQALPFVDWSAQWLPDKLKPVVHQWQLEQVLPGSSMVQRKKRL